MDDGKARSAEPACHRHDSADDRYMWAKIDVPCVGGPVDGRSVAVPVDDDGVPPETIDQNWLWVEYGSELLDADMSGAYELETIAGGGPPWVYVWTRMPPGQPSTGRLR